MSTLMKLTPPRRKILIVMMQVAAKKKTSLMKGLLLKKRIMLKEKSPHMLLLQPTFKVWRTSGDLSMDNIIGDINRGVSTRSSISNFCLHTAFVSNVEPKSIFEALKDEF